jgi:phage gp29-like protein
VPARIVKRAQRRFKFVQADENSPPELRLLTKNNMLTGEPLPVRKFIVHRVNPEDDNPYGTGLGLQLYWPEFFKRKGLVSWNKLNDRFGSPTPWGRYPRNAGPKEKGTLFSALKAMSNDGVLMTPEGMAIELLETKLTGSVTTQQALCEYMDDWIAEVILGQEPRKSGGGALAAASKERASVRLDLVQADSDLLSVTLNESLILWICELNGLATCQVSREISEEEDKKAESETDKNVTEMGFELSEDAVQEKYGQGWSKKAEPVVPPPDGTVKKSPDGASPDAGQLSNFAEPGGVDAIDALVEEAMGDWQAMMQPLADPLQAALDASVAAGETAEQFLARLPALLEEMDPAQLHARLAKAAFTSRLGGNAGVGDA